MAKTDLPKNPIRTEHVTNNTRLNELMADLLLQKRAFCVSYGPGEIIVSYAGPSTPPKE